jgi:F-type H+-transporting ATPase subunit delta
MITGTSRASLAIVRERLDALAGQLTTSEARSSLASELYAVADLFASQPRLRRAAADPASKASSRRELVDRLLTGKVSATCLDIVRTAVQQRWTSAWDLGDSLEQVADDALLASAEADGTLGEVEDELFRLERILGAEPELTTLLDQADVPGERRAALARRLLAGKASPVTQELVEHAVASARKRSIEHAVEALLEAAAAGQARSIARIISAVTLTDAQEDRIARTLTAMYGRPISVRTSVEPAIQGGLVIRVADEVIDGSVATRIAMVRKTIAG